MSKHWNYDEARGMRAEGISWDEIGRVFGVSSHTAHVRTDPVYAAKRRAQINEARRIAALGRREHTKPETVVAAPSAGKIIETASGRAYQVKHFDLPNPITLPYLSILGASS